MKQESERRCPWCLGSTLYQQYHDSEWGVPCRDEQILFEFLLLEGAQAGLSWSTILHKRNAYRLLFDNFDPTAVARYQNAKTEQLLSDSRIVRNRQKIKSAIGNARAFLSIQERYGSFSEYIWHFVDHTPVQNNFACVSDIPASSALSEHVSRQLKKAGFSFVGPTICYSFMQAMGLINDHIVSCPRHEACRKLA